MYQGAGGAPGGMPGNAIVSKFDTNVFFQAVCQVDSPVEPLVATSLLAPLLADQPSRRSINRTIEGNPTVNKAVRLLMFVLCPLICS